MEISEVFNKHTICRICLQKETDLYPIFDKVKPETGGKKNTVAEILTECTKYPVDRDDKLPTNICTACLELARSAYSFKRQTEEAYCRLKVLYDITWKDQKKDGDKGTPTSNNRRVADRYTQTEKTSVFQCESCPKKFFVVGELRQHRVTAHNYEGKKCRVCGEKFNYLGQLKVHLSTEHPSEGIRCDYRCHVCMREFARKDHLKRHLTKVHKIKESSLKISKVSLDEPEIQIENRTSHSSSTALNNYSSHWPDYEDDDDEPDNANTTTQSEKAAVVTNPISSDEEVATKHDDDKDMEDEEDVKHFVDNLSPSDVSIKVEPIEIMDNYSYDDYEYVDGVKRQMEKDSSANEIITPTYNIKDDIQDDMHDEIHDDIRDIKEEHQRYFDESDMSHLLDYPEPGNSIDNLVYMRNEVTNLYHCDQCPLEFKLLRNLRRHLLTHSDNRPFNCEFCEKTFKRKDNLQKHLRDIHSEKHFSCKACDKGFATYGQLQRHQLTQRHRKNR